MNYHNLNNNSGTVRKSLYVLTALFAVVAICVGTMAVLDSQKATATALYSKETIASNVVYEMFQ